MSASRKILIVDDEELIRQFIEAFLETSLAKENLGILQAGSLEEARPHLLNELAFAIVDVNLALKDGGRASSVIRDSNILARHLYRRQVPVIRITATPEELDPEFQPGGRFAPIGVLKKPFSLVQLHGLVSKALNRS